ncbi:hypothetical protein AVEN_131013-1 [Araneus ventricosus]|uniref:Uncharacterized protein n=1 Tax=Araneus ventricosus TaxID=182803 RepID=A0A4Y2TUU4_ARAVE|nr:hypothetical protein AVEN_131013-1 [Araneus ventricosus]
MKSKKTLFIQNVFGEGHRLMPVLRHKFKHLEIAPPQVQHITAMTPDKAANPLLSKGRQLYTSNIQTKESHSPLERAMKARLGRAPLLGGTERGAGQKRHF